MSSLAPLLTISGPIWLNLSIYHPVDYKLLCALVEPGIISA